MKIDIRSTTIIGVRHKKKVAMAGDGQVTFGDMAFKQKAVKVREFETAKGDFAGGLLKYLAKHPFERLTLAGGFAKLSKLAGGHMDLHSSRSIVDLVTLADCAGTVGANEKTQESIKIANTAMEALTIAQSADVALGDAVAARARGVAMATLAGGTEVDVMIFGRTGELVGRAGEDT